jgi:hypothetical protein
MKCLLVYSLVLDFWDRVSLCNPRLALNSPFSSLYFPGIHLKCYFKHADSMMSPFRKALATSTLLSGKTRLPRNILMTSMPPLILKLHSGQVVCMWTFKCAYHLASKCSLNTEQSWTIITKVKLKLQWSMSLIFIVSWVRMMDGSIDQSLYLDMNTIPKVLQEVSLVIWGTLNSRIWEKDHLPAC